MSKKKNSQDERNGMGQCEWKDLQIRTYPNRSCWGWPCGTVSSTAIWDNYLPDWKPWPVHLCPSSLVMCLCRQQKRLRHLSHVTQAGEVEFLALGFALGQPRLLWPFEERIRTWKTLFSISLCHAAVQISKHEWLYLRNNIMKYKKNW